MPGYMALRLKVQLFLAGIFVHFNRSAIASFKNYIVKVFGSYLSRDIYDRFFYCFFVALVK